MKHKDREPQDLEKVLQGCEADRTQKTGKMRSRLPAVPPMPMTPPASCHIQDGAQKGRPGKCLESYSMGLGFRVWNPEPS